MPWPNVIIFGTLKQQFMSDEGIPTDGMSRISPDPLVQKAVDA